MKINRYFQNENPYEFISELIKISNPNPLNETLFVAKQAITVTGKPFTMYIFVGIIYLGFSSIITLTVIAVERYGKRTTTVK